MEKDKINNHSKSDHDLEVILNLKWGLERHCDVIFWLRPRLVGEIKWNLSCSEFVYAVVWRRTVCYCFTMFTCDLQHQKFLWFILFNSVSCYRCFGHCFIALSTYAEPCFVEKSIDALPVFNLGFCLVTFDFWSVESLEEEGDFLGVSCAFNELLTVPCFILF